MRVLLLLVTVVMRPSFDYLHIPQLYARAWSLRRHKAAQRNNGGHSKRNRGEEAEDILESNERGVHRAKVECGEHSLERIETSLEVWNQQENVEGKGEIAGERWVSNGSSKLIVEVVLTRIWSCRAEVGAQPYEPARVHAHRTCR